MPNDITCTPGHSQPPQPSVAEEDFDAWAYSSSGGAGSALLVKFEISIVKVGPAGQSKKLLMLIRRTVTGPVAWSERRAISKNGGRWLAISDAGETHTTGDAAIAT